ncbi:uncharacterized protein THITE_114732 [Thermothielavioides terrestris NRRL 8126]|uniref:F-box domain-containing protein n=1 Tax=Thermothielavioides terrestris (strain ATCC 38088 / NRRL 8126) TaxID=578455 RepID=G2RCE8_THETT|nr:uncharacterized protein THITE_114732 [Thermothielavioides terrestris NRRL 8126]AEO70583.1 hypothetical protein THITE_114732 [Thermothielavioides terrestris NRRL 8126]
MPLLETLPVELLELVAEQLVDEPSTHRASSGSTDPGVALELASYCPHKASKVQKARDRGVAILCRTSRRLNAVFTRHLYRRPNLSKWGLLARTLLARPGLAQHVKALCFPLAFAPPNADSTVPPEVLAYFNAQNTTYSQYTNWENWSYDLAGTPDGRIRYEQRAMAIMTSLCPHALTLEFRLSWFDPPLFFAPGSMPPLFFAPGSMPRLHTVELPNCDDCDLWACLYLPWISHLFAAAPNLRVIRGFNFTVVSHEDVKVTAESVLEVEFHHVSMTADGLRAMLKAFPRLETLRYRGPVSRLLFHPDEARDLLMHHAPRLKRVSMDLRGPTMTGAVADPWAQWFKEEKENTVQAFHEQGVEFRVTFSP